jgi:hypothetical protein
MPVGLRKKNLKLKKVYRFLEDSGNDQEIEFQEIEIGILQLFAKLMRRSKRP